MRTLIEMQSWTSIYYYYYYYYIINVIGLQIAYVCSYLIAGNAVSISAEGLDVHLLPCVGSGL